MYIAESDRSTTLDAMWTAYRRSRLGNAESCPRCRTGLRLVALVLVYRIETANGKSGEGVGAAATTTFGYDYAGQRVFTQTASSTTVFPSKYFSVTSSQVGSSTLATSTSYIYSNDQLVAFVEQQLIDGVATGTAATYYVHPDHLGSINVLSTASGTVQFVKDYLPYGAERLTSGDTGMRRGYIGEFEEGGNLSYLNARFYQSDRGQFLSQDPIFWEVGQSQVGRAILQNPQLLNSYAYAADNPITGKDPDGRLVELMTRPISGPLGTVGAHGFVAVIPENPNTIGSIPGVNMSRPFTLGGYTNAPEQWNLYKEAGTSIESTDYSYAFGGNTKGAAQVIVNPPSGMTQEEFERRIVESYNGLPSTLSESSYGAFGQIKLTGKPNSNNTASSILLGAGVSGSQINSYQTQLYAQNFRVAPGLGTSAFASTYGQSISSGLNATLNSLKSALTTLLGVLSSKK